jgi:hypothetical protein
MITRRVQFPSFPFFFNFFDYYAVLDVYYCSEISEKKKKRSRTRQHVADVVQKKKCVQFMIDEVAAGRLESEAIKKFPKLFSSLKYNTNLIKAKRWFKNRDKIMNYQGSVYMTRWSKKKRKVQISRVMVSGRGPKTAKWVKWLYAELLEEFRRLIRAGVPMSSKLLVDMAKSMIIDSKDENGEPHPEHGRETRFGKKGLLLSELITHAWIGHFRGINDVVWRSLKGRLMASPKKELLIARRIAFHLGNLKRMFDSGELIAAEQSNMDETHMLYSMKTKRMLSFKNQEVVKYTDVVKGSEGISVCLTIVGGDKSSHLSDPMLIFINKLRSYPIRGSPDNVDNACYRTAPKGFMEARLMKQWLLEQRTWGKRPDDQKRVLWLDNCSAHSFDDEVTEMLNTLIQFFPPNSTDKLQPCDSFIIQKFKSFWNDEWSKWRVQAIIDARYKERGKSWSGFLEHPPRSWYLRTAALCVKKINEMKDQHGVGWPQKAMVLCGLGLPEDGIWRTTMLKKELQKIIIEHPRYFSGELDPAVEDIDITKENEDEELTNPTREGIEVFFGGYFVKMNIVDYLHSLAGGERSDHMELATKIRRKFDNNSISHLELMSFLREAMPVPIPLFGVPYLEAPTETRVMYAKVMAKSIRKSLEIHDIEVSHVMKSIHLTMERSQSVTNLNWQPMEPASPTGRSLPSADVLTFGLVDEGTTGQVFYTSDHFELMLINSKLLQNPRTVGNRRSAIIHADSLDYQTQEPTMKRLPSMRSQMIMDTVSDTCDSVLVIPCVLQPRGSRICGIAACFNMLLLSTESLDQILDNGCNRQLAKYQLPDRDKWTRNDWKCAALVLVHEFIKGKESVSTVETLLTEISKAIKAQNYFIEEIHEWNDSAEEKEDNEEEKRTKKKPKVSTKKKNTAENGKTLQTKKQKRSEQQNNDKEQPKKKTKSGPKGRQTTLSFAAQNESMATSGNQVESEGQNEIMAASGNQAK